MCLCSSSMPPPAKPCCRSACPPARLPATAVVVCAPTGAGKTAIAEAATMHYLEKGQRVIYTTPLKALSNQKLGEMRERFGCVFLAVPCTVPGAVLHCTALCRVCCAARCGGMRRCAEALQTCGAMWRAAVPTCVYARCCCCISPCSCAGWRARGCRRAMPPLILKPLWL